MRQSSVMTKYNHTKATTLKIDIYTSTVRGDKYLTVPKGTRVEDLVLPASIDPDLLTLSPFRTRLEIDPKKSHVALDEEDIFKQIEATGYAIHGAKTVITLKAS